MDELNKKLHEAIEDGDVDVVRAMLQQGVDIDAEIAAYSAVDEAWVKQALHRAIIVDGNPEIVRLLIEAGANVNLKCQRIAPIHLAAGSGRVDLCEMLIKAGADVDIRNEDASAPLHLAANEGYMEVCRLLLQYGADLHAKGSSDETPLHEAALGNRPQVCRLLIEHGASLVVLTSANETPLGMAAAHGCLDACREMVALGADPSYLPESPNDNYLTPFQAAVANAQMKVVRYFALECAIDLRQSTHTGIALQDLPFETRKKELIRQGLLSLETELAVRGVLGEPGADQPQKRSAGLSPL